MATKIAETAAKPASLNLSLLMAMTTKPTKATGTDRARMVLAFMTSTDAAEHRAHLSYPSSPK